MDTKILTTKKAGLTNKYVHNLCRQLIPHKMWLGVHPCDQLCAERTLSRAKVLEEWYLIVNTALSNEAYGHFMTILKRKNIIVCFDPLGHIYSDVNVNRFLKLIKNDCEIILNKNAIQHPLSAYCGFMNIAFIVSIQKQICNVENFESYFFTNPPSLENDNIAKHIIVTIIQNGKQSK